jgi:type II secretory pathway pseudopilin PulG
MIRRRCHADRAMGPRALRAFTMAEALLAATILAIISASASLPFSAGVHQANEAAKLRRAATYAQQMMEEIMARPYYEPGLPINLSPEADDTDRTKFDDVGEFHGFNEKSTGLRNYRNEDINDPDAPGWWRDVQVTFVVFPMQQGGDTNGFQRVRVRVFDGNTTTPLLTIYRLASLEE